MINVQGVKRHPHNFNIKRIAYTAKLITTVDIVIFYSIFLTIDGCIYYMMDGTYGWYILYNIINNYF